jgi:hypothetical protein
MAHNVIIRRHQSQESVKKYNKLFRIWFYCRQVRFKTLPQNRIPYIERLRLATIEFGRANSVLKTSDCSLLVFLRQERGLGLDFLEQRHLLEPIMVLSADIADTSQPSEN